MAIRTAHAMLPEDEDWWSEENTDRAGALLTSDARRINEAQTWRQRTAQRLSAKFAGHPDGDGVNSNCELAGTAVTTTRNVIRQAVTTVHPKVSKHRPLPQMMSTAGSWKDQKRAKKATQYLDGIYDKQSVFETHWQTDTRDALIYGDGNTVAFQDGPTIITQHILWWELLFDAFDARDGDPRCAYWVHTVDLGIALQRWGTRQSKKGAYKESEIERDERLKIRADLRDASTSTPDPNWDIEGQFTSIRKKVRVVQGWHLCDNVAAHKQKKMPKHECNGRHRIAILGNESLVFDEPWEWDVFPFARVYCDAPLAGVRGSGLARGLEGWQTRITNQADKVDDAHRMLGFVAMMMNDTSGIVTTEFSNDGPMCFVKFSGAVPPQPVPIPVLADGVYQRERDMPGDALNEKGISLQSAAGQKHPGVNSGIGIETIDDIEDEHWVPFGRAAESWSLQLARMYLRLAAKIAKEFGEYEVQVKMGDNIVHLKWADVSLNDFQVRVFPSSVLPQQVGNRLEKLKMLFEAGLIDRQVFLQQLGAPDLSAELDLITAVRINIDEKLEGILDAETPEQIAIALQRAQPNSYLDFKWMQLRAQQRLMKAETDGAPEENLEALRNICDACEHMKDEERIKNQTQQPAMPSPVPSGPEAGAMPPGGAGGPPMPMNGAPPGAGFPPTMPAPNGMPQMPMGQA